mmetsp:Transcript_2881/g.5094  ORF Transcript_2881/g.5094 Transcript_2881/m.5094 type:complete len:331 (-) Transcript_2881:190-1182(-)
MDRKAPPQAATEEDSKLPPAAVAAVTTPHETSSKRRKLDTNNRTDAAAASSSSSSSAAAATVAATATTKTKEEVVDVAAELRFEPGDRIEVKWTINDDDDDESDGEGQKNGDGDETMTKEANNNVEDENPKTVTVWWGATLCGKTEDMHTLSHEEKEESEITIDIYKSPEVKVPVYKLNYSPLEEHGFETHSLEDVAFISNQTLLNLSTNEMMTFRKVGSPSPPHSPIPESNNTSTTTDESSISQEFTTKDEIKSFMNTLMQSCLKNTGMDERMKNMPPSEQLVMAEKIREAQDGFFGKMMEETEKMGEGNRVITADVVRRCMTQMKGGY